MLAGGGPCESGAAHRTGRDGGQRPYRSVAPSACAGVSGSHDSWPTAVSENRGPGWGETLLAHLHTTRFRSEDPLAIRCDSHARPLSRQQGINTGQGNTVPRRGCLRARVRRTCGLGSTMSRGRSPWSATDRAATKRTLSSYRTWRFPPPRTFSTVVVPVHALEKSRTLLS